jgi:hypothetical protein
MADQFGRGNLFLGDGQKACPVQYRIQTGDCTYSLTIVTGTIEVLPPSPAGRTGPSIQEVSNHAAKPNEVLLLDLKKGGQWVFVRLASLTDGVFHIGADSHIVDPPAWAAPKDGGA